MSFTPRSDDVYVASYPRSGTTWMQAILQQLRSRDATFAFNHIEEVSPYFDVALQSELDLDALPSPRVLKTHLPYSVVGANPGRFVYIQRDGRDVAVSYFHFYRDYYGSSLSFEEFFDHFLRGQLRYGSWFRHVADWRAHQGDGRILFARYEQLSCDFISNVNSVVRFLGWATAEETCSLIQQGCSFVTMKHEESRFAPVEANKRGLSHKFLRNGATGEWERYLNPSQQEAFDRLCEQYSGISEILQ